MSHSILIIEDNNELARYVQEILVEQGFSVQTLDHGATAMEVIDTTQPDLVLLDLGLPDINGESLCRQVKSSFPKLPVIIFTAKDSVNDVVNGLNLGADDYITKPFAIEELVARIRARLRQSNEMNPILQVGDLVLNTQTIEVKRGTKDISLTPQEFKLLQYLMQNTGKVLTRDMILNRLWSDALDIETRVVDVYVGYLRKKIDQDQKQKLIQSVRGFGYVIKAD